MHVKCKFVVTVTWNNFAGIKNNFTRIKNNYVGIRNVFS